MKDNILASPTYYINIINKMNYTLVK